MNLFNKLDKTVVLRAKSVVENYIKNLEELKEKTIGNLREDIEKEIKICVAGEKGENEILYELSNMNLGMYVIRDLTIVSEGTYAQIDFVIITRKQIFFVECKNFMGNINVDNNGRFVREYTYNGVYKKESIYSPITQLQRHLDVFKSARMSKQNLIDKAFFEKEFKNNFRGYVVFSNPKSIIRDMYAPKEIQEQIIKSDELIRRIKEDYEKSELHEISDSKMLEIAESYVKMNNSRYSDYELKYNKFLKRYKESLSSVTTSNDVIIEEKTSAKNIDELVNKLKKYRYETAKKENIKPYFIFSDKEMEELIQKNPNDSKELLNVKGFAEKKVEKYGEDILKILKEYN